MTMAARERRFAACCAPAVAWSALLVGCGGGGTGPDGDAGETTIDAPVAETDGVEPEEATAVDTAPEDAVEEPDVAPDESPDVPEEDAAPEDGAPPPACPVPGDLGPGDHTRHIDFGGRDRSCILHVPESYDPSSPVPLVVNVHGYMSAAWQQVLFSNMNPTADARGFVVAYPDGYVNSWNAGTCCGRAASEGLDDVGLLRAFVADISTALCIDRRRVYATGMSNGGYMSHRLGCEAADLFAAVAPVAGAMGIPDCAPSRPMPLIAFHGLQDGLVPYAEGRAALDLWLDLNGCAGEPARTDFGASYCETWTGCAEGIDVAFCTLDPMGHCWPGGSSALCLAFIGPYNDDINANEAMWEFFSRFPLP